MPTVVLLGTMALTIACGSKRPVIYPSAHAQQVGEAQQKRDIEECQQLAAEHASSVSTGNAAHGAASTARGGAIGAASGAAGGAIYGNAGSGAAAGAAGGAVAGFLSWLLRPHQPPPGYVGIVNQCLRDRGYQVAGWQ